MFDDALLALDDADLVSVIQFWERAASVAAAGQLAAIGELARRRPRSFVDSGPDGHADGGDPSVPEVSEFAVDEVAAALRLSRPAAGARLHVAVELTRLPDVATALADGRLDLPKVRAVVDTVAGLDAGTAVAVAARVLPRAGRQTVGQLRASLTRAALAADPAAAQKRHEVAVAGRQVTLRPARDGLAELWAILPADAAVAVYQRVDALAREADPAGRTMDARRADALVTAVLVGRSPAAEVVGARAGAGAGPRATGAAVEAGTTAGAVYPSPGGPVSGGPVSGGPVSGGPVSGGPPAGADDSGPVIRAAGVHVTVAVTTVLGLDEQPGELVGFGPVPASMTRRLADGARWRKVSTDPVTRAPTEIGRTAYTPSAALADLVRIRDRTCRFPGCRQPARRCDLDHVTPWPEGTTTADNLVALCRHHHRLKHQTRWTVRAGPGAALAWISPAGHRYATTPAD